MRQHENEVQALDLRIVVLTFEARERAGEYVRETGLRWPLLIDRRRALYGVPWHILLNTLPDVAVNMQGSW